MKIGVDSWSPPTQEAIDALKLIDGFSFWAGYIGGTDLYLNTPWPKSAWDLLKANGIEPLPIWVPSQNCTDNPVQVAQEAIATCVALGLTGVVAIDSEHSMSGVLNFAHFLDSIFEEINGHGWLSVNYAGANYASPLASVWVVKWGEHEEIPLTGEAIQYGPYVLRTPNGTPIMDVDSDSADDHFPFATYIGESQSPTVPTTNQTEPTTVVDVPVNPPKEIKEEELATVLMNDGHTWYAVDTVNWTKKPVESVSEGSSLVGVFTDLKEPVPVFLAKMPVVQE